MKLKGMNISYKYGDTYGNADNVDPAFLITQLGIPSTADCWIEDEYMGTLWDAYEALQNNDPDLFQCDNCGSYNYAGDTHVTGEGEYCYEKCEHMIEKYYEDKEEVA